MRLFLALLCLVVAIGASNDVDEDLLVPHALDASETSDREILESLNEHEETTVATTLTSTTTTTATTTSATTKPAPTYPPGLVELLESLHFNVKKMLNSNVSVASAKKIVRKFLAKKALIKARAEARAEYLRREDRRRRARALRRAQRKAAEERRQARLLRQAQAAKEAAEAEARRKAADYIPASLKKVMMSFNLDPATAENMHEPISAIQEDVTKREKAAEAIVHANEEKEAEAAMVNVEKELEEGMKEPLAEEQRVENMQREAALKVLKVRQEGEKHDMRVIDTVRRREARLKARLEATRRAIIQEAQREEHDAEVGAKKNAATLREEAKKDILATEEAILKQARKAAKLGAASKHWLVDQAIPSVNAFIKSEKAKLKKELSDIEVTAKYQTLRLQKMLQGQNL